MEIRLQPSWHHLTLSDVEKDLKTSREQGLSQFDVKHRQLQFGPNRVASRPAKSPLVRFLVQFNQPLIYILLAAGLFTLILQEWSDSSFILGVVLINAVVGFLQEAKAESAMAALKSMVLTNATVIREGRKDVIVSEDLVPGDLVLLQSGDKVPADLRLFWTKDLQIDESMLTGESVPVHKTSDIQPEDLVLADRRNMAYAGNLVTYGQARGWVTAIGEQTETGKIAHLISAAADLSTFRKRTAGPCRATPPKRPCWSAGSRRVGVLIKRFRLIRAWMSFRLNPSASTWLPCTAPTKDRRSCI